MLTQGSTAAPDLAATTLLPSLPAVYELATVPERCALVRMLFDQLWMEKHRLVAITPTSPCLPLLAAA